ncbi:MAG: hypothetical protein WD929_02485 [Steroidobacteraceae bacterium]
MSAIDGNPSHPKGYHARAGAKASWHEITDELPRFDAAATTG